MIRTKNRVRRSKRSKNDTWIVITEDARKLNRQVSEESDKFVYRIDSLIDMIVACKAA